MLSNTQQFDVTGHPAITVPCGMSSGLPIGMMFTAKWGDEATLYRLAGQLEQALDELDRRVQPELVIYLAGADPHEGDRLGRLKLTWDGLEARDRRVFDWCWQRRVPMAFAMAGGYGQRIEDTVQAQVNTYRVALEYWQRWQNLPLHKKSA